MPLSVKPLPQSDTNSEAEEALKTEDRLAQFVRSEIDRALRDVDRRKMLASAELEAQARRASKRIVSSGYRLERSLHGAPLPVVPVTIGLAIIGAALVLSHRS
ncbi:hypothetical protein [Asticcacaulis sp.]|uniref:hypothetical protein n=1 Tax=Asticcacaulis sp. TaxID=1872648 RepID=UPI003F7BD6AB